MNTETPKTDDLKDRLLDQALRETLSGETPPDLSDKILAAASKESARLSNQTPENVVVSGRHKKTQKRWALLAIAASLLLAVGLTLPAMQSAREIAQQSSGLSNNKNEKTLPSAVTLPNAVYVSDEPQEIVQEAEPLQEPLLQGSGSEYAHINSSKMNRSGKAYEGNEESSESISSEGSDSGFGSGLDGAGDGVIANTPQQATDFDMSSRERGQDSSSEDSLFAESPLSVTGKVLDRFREPQDRKAYTIVDSEKVKVHPVADLVLPLGDLGSRLGKGSDGDQPLSPEDAQLLPSAEKLTVAVDALDGLNTPYVRRQFRNTGEQGTGPDTSGDQYTRIHENPFITATGEEAVSTFSIDVDTASYANVRQFLMRSATLPPPDAVRIEELINYFDYNYSGPKDDVPFASHVEIAGCPWHPEHRLVRVGIKGRDIERKSRPQSNLVFLIDVSGSMNNSDKLPLLVEGMKMLTRELGENDRVAIVVYASSEGLALPSTRGDHQDTILAALEKLRAGGSTAGGAGIQLAYQIAQDHFIEGGVNRVILATDGDFNVGTTSTSELERLAEAKAKDTGIFLTVLGFGRGNLNDAMMEAISGKGNGNYHYVDNQTEARKVLVEEMVGTLITIAKDVKIQIEFNPTQVAGYRLIGYENRMLRTEDFNDDKKDAGEIGAGHTVTALYEIVPAGQTVEAGTVDPLKYQSTKKTDEDSSVRDGPVSNELLTLKIRYKQPDGDTSTKLEFPITDNGTTFSQATPDFKFASAVASFGMLLRNSQHQGNTSYDAVLEIAESTINLPSSGHTPDPHGYRAEFLQLVQQAKALTGK